MKCREHDSPALVSSLPYSSSLATSASASSQSVWSDASSQSSDDTSVSTNSDSDSCDSSCRSRQSSAIKFKSPWTNKPLPTEASAVPAVLRQNPRRSSTGSTSRTGCPPALLRQCERKLHFVDSLVDSSTQIVEAIWPLSSILCRSELGSKAVLSLRTFIQETLRRSRTSYSTLQVALYYLVLIKPHVPKHDFTMEQPDDSPASRVLQCGRRMFLAALILASKYLQDRNYSARAWSRISGLPTEEINQNEMVFLNAVRWKLHIADEVFKRWTDIVLKYTPPAPPSPGTSSQAYTQECLDWKQLILKLSPQLDNIESLIPVSPRLDERRKSVRDFTARSVLDVPSTNTCGFGYDSAELTTAPKPKAYQTPIVMEPTLATVHTPGRMAPALGLLPTPRLTPQTSGFSTPAVSAVPHLLGSKSCAMGLAMAQASNACATHALDRWPTTVTSSPSPLGYFPARRSSLANSVSTASSPESMVSDSSRTSRSSSISSASSLSVPSAACPTFKLGVTPARFRSSKLAGERGSHRAMTAIIASVPEDYEENQYAHSDVVMTASPETYTGPVGGKLGDMSLDTPLARRQHEMELDDAAARALQELHHYGLSAESTPTPTAPAVRAKAGSKRSRTSSMDASALQDNVRDMLSGRYEASAWPETLVRSRRSSADGRKRVCCSTEASEAFEHPAMRGFRGPGMWEGILN